MKIPVSLIFIYFSFFANGQSWVNKNLVAHYAFDNVSLVDSSTSGVNLNDSLRVNAVADRFGHPGAAVNFDGNGWIKGSSHHLPDSIETRSFSMWINVDDTLGPASFVFFYGRRVAGRGNGLGLLSDGRLFYSGFQINLEAINPIPFDQWIHVGLTFDGDTAKLYIDGMLARFATVQPGAWFTENLNPELNFGYLGEVGANQTPIDFYDGVLDDFRAYSRELSANEIAMLANDQLLGGLGLIASEKNISCLEVYPNPANDQLFILGSNGQKQYQIVDRSGQVLLHSEAINQPLDISKLSSGMYLLIEYENDRPTAAAQFVKE